MTRKLVFAASLMIIVVSMLGVASDLHVGYASPYTDVDVDTAYDMITNGSFPNLVALDVRTKSEYDSGHVYGAVWIPVDELERRIEELAEHEDHEIIVYCLSGGRSATASGILDSNNFTKVYNMLEGFSVWQSSGYPVWIATVHNLDTTINYDTIQAAIDAPQTMDGHTIFVEEGTYFEFVTADKAVSLIGENRSTTVIARCLWIYASNVKISNFTIGGHNGFAICVQNCGNNSFINNVLNSSQGVWLDNSTNNTFRENIFSVNSSGLTVTPYEGLEYYIHTIDTSNTINGKAIYYWVNQHDKQIPVDAGFVAVINSTNIGIENLSFQENNYGVLLAYANESWIDHINGSRIWAGIFMTCCHDITARNNIFSDCLWGILLVNSDNNKICNNSMSDNDVAIYFDESHRNIAKGNFASSNYEGVHLDASDNNTISDNTICWNSVGIAGLVGSEYNSIYRNNFINNTSQVYHYEWAEMSEVNFWDDGYPSGGNYWSDYNGTDMFSGPDQNGAGCDGIGDISYEIDENNHDNYPLMGMFSDFNATSEYYVQTICNSSISDFRFNGTAISFNVSGENGTSGFCRICIRKALINGTYRVFVNGTEILPAPLPLPCSNTTHNYLYFNYTHSTQEVVIVPEFQTFIILPVFMIATLMAVIIYRKKTF